MEQATVQIKTTVNAPVEKAWEYFTAANHVTGWNHASDDWHSPHGEADVRTGGKFSFRMEAKDGSFGFDFGGVYDEVRPNEYLSYTLGDNRKVEVNFKSLGNQTEITETFEPESTHRVEFQQSGWQAILDNYKKYVEAN